MSMKKILALVLCMVLVAGLSIGGTLAWITAKTNPLTNTFTVGNITINLDEAKVENGVASTTERVTAGNAYKLIPGTSYVKDPTVTVKAGSEKCYLFVEFKEEGNASTYLTYASKLDTQNGWTKGNGTKIPSNVWYRTVEASGEDQSWELLVKNTDGTGITVKNTVTETNMTAASAAKLTYTAYAVQFVNMNDAADAWSNRATAN